MHYPSWLSDVRFLILDLDGTVYQDLEFHRELCLLALGKRWDCRTIDLTVSMIEQILAGHPKLRMPDFVRLRHLERIIPPTPPGRDAARCSRADPSVLFLRAQVLRTDPLPPIDASAEDLVSLADAWSVTFAVLRLFDLTDVDRRRVFYAVRSMMLERLEPHEELNRALRSSRLYKILQTNSPEDTGTEFVSALLEPASFHEIWCDAGKPRGLRELLKRLIGGGVRPNEILTVGDHPWNDLKPAHDLGCRTVLISPYPGMPDGVWDLRLRTLDELAGLVRSASVSATSKNEPREACNE
ncbi:MAG: HAD family hydrolase [Spirochaetota bacterium]